jgi:hypothetical protein
MIQLIQWGVMDTSFLVPLQVFQTWMFILVKATWVAEFAPKRLAWVEESDSFIYASDLVEGIASA